MWYCGISNMGFFIFLADVFSKKKFVMVFVVQFTWLQSNHVVQILKSRKWKITTWKLKVCQTLVLLPEMRKTRNSPLSEQAMARVVQTRLPPLLLLFDEGVSLSLCFKHCYSRKQHISQAWFQLWLKSQHCPGFLFNIITLNPFPLGRFCVSVIGFRISIFHHFENS